MGKGSLTAAIEALKEATGHTIEIRQSKYLNHRVEQAHRAVKQLVRPMRGFQSFRSARVTLHGIELLHLLKKGQMVSGDTQKSVRRRTVLFIGGLKTREGSRTALERN